MLKKITVVAKLYSREVYFGFACSRFVPVPMRGFLWRLGGVKIGPGSRMRFGIVVQRGELEIGQGFACGWNCLFDATARITIGDHVRMGPRVIVLSNDHSIQPSVIRREATDNRFRHTVIGTGCWIGANVTILPGVKIGEGCVVGAGSIVTRDCQPNGLYVGNPARRVKDLPVTDRSAVVPAIAARSIDLPARTASALVAG